jgi:hypothetical protein
MQDIIDKLGQVMPLKYQVALGIAWLLAQAMGRAYHAIVNEGGVKAIWGALICGVNTPKQAALDKHIGLGGTDIWVTKGEENSVPAVNKDTVDKHIGLGGTAVWGVALLGLLLTGCVSEKTTVTATTDGTNMTYVTNTTTALDVVSTSNALYQVSYIGTYGAIQGSTIAGAADVRSNIVTGVSLASSAFAVIYADTNFSSLALSNALVSVGVTDTNVLTIIDAALVVYDAYAQEIVEKQLDKVTWLQPCIVAIERGMYAGLKRAGYAKWDESLEVAYVDSTR